MKAATALVALGLLAGCTSGQTLEVNDNLSEDELLSKTEHALGAQITERFGDKARLAGAVVQNQKTVLLVANEPTPENSDAQLAYAIAVHDPKANKLEVPAPDFAFKEARILGDKTALVKQSGELELKSASGTKTLATLIKGDLQPLKTGELLATQNHAEEGDANSRVVLVTESGETKVIADGAGSDDRAAISPDGKTVLFVSARTSFASFYVTDTSGAEAVQLTNKELQVAFDGTEPTGFVPVPVDLTRLTWVSNDVVRYDAGGDELWTVNVRTGEAKKVGGVE